MNGFDDDQMGSILEESAEESLRQFMRDAERRHFPKAPLVAELEVISARDPATLTPNHVIQVSKNIIVNQKMCKVLVIHELIHLWLFHRDNGDADVKEGPRFQVEVERLWREGAYKRLL